MLSSAAAVDKISSSATPQERAAARPQMNLNNLPFRRMSMPVVPKSEPTHLRPPSLESLFVDNDTTVSHSQLEPPKSKLRQPSPRKPTKATKVSRPPSITSPNFKPQEPFPPMETILPIDETSARYHQKRWNLIAEFCQTERTYLDGLDLIYTHFLVPLICSLESPTPILSRSALNTVFSNFIDIWNLHRSFYSSLSVIVDDPSFLLQEGHPPSLAPILHSHFPYLSLYTLFISSFQSTISSIAHLRIKNPAFSSFLKAKESDGICRRLGLQAWLLTIVQRCPRYLLLLRDLIEFTPKNDPEHTDLSDAYALLSKITLSMNASLHTHSQTLALLALQKSTQKLPFPLVAAGRTLVRRASLIMSDRTTEAREFLLFSDCLLWLVCADSSQTNGLRLHDSSEVPLKSGRPRLGPRTRSRSAAELPQFRSALSSPAIPQLLGQSAERQWIFKGHLSLLDLEVVAGQSRPEFRFDILSPERSFALYAPSLNERDEWVSAIRSTKASLIIGLNGIQHNTTLTSSQSSEHLRRNLQALPYSPDADNRGSLRRGRVDHFIPPIWVPDRKAQTCMRCSREFGWLRRRHHCRLCGRCVCATCSEKTFFVVGPASAKRRSKAARACNACYETVFPVLTANTSTIKPKSDFDGTLTMPMWRTTKQTQLAVSVLQLLAGTSLDGEVASSGTHEIGQDNTPRQSILERSRANHRFSAPVLALQETSVTTHTPESGRRTRRLSLGISHQGSNPQLSSRVAREGEAATQLQGILHRVSSFQ